MGGPGGRGFDDSSTECTVSQSPDSQTFLSMRCKGRPSPTQSDKCKLEPVQPQPHASPAIGRSSLARQASATPRHPGPTRATPLPRSQSRYLHFRMHPFGFMRCTAANRTMPSRMLPEITSDARVEDGKSEGGRKRRLALQGVGFCCTVAGVLLSSSVHAEVPHPWVPVVARMRRRPIRGDCVWGGGTRGRPSLATTELDARSLSKTPPAVLPSPLLTRGLQACIRAEIRPLAACTPPSRNPVCNF